MEIQLKDIIFILKFYDFITKNVNVKNQFASLVSIDGILK